ncbi:hypothetical protein OHA72_50225 [Dactylosporangium sp. NBC_01737]|uniref:hypothetical protein n=1 Tax=Dactylosporangium sp. NBC_01737 TaxID=2975959 RepID=UPI002E127A6D|nr:hypothetical protein OHA72_50225 [Dactylosporangium sp. NBC_01737]
MVLDEAVVARNIRHLTDSVPADLLELLVTAGFWTPRHALSHALRPASLRERSDVLYHRVPHPLPTDPQAAAYAVGAPVTELEQDGLQAEALAGLAAHLPAHLLGEALVAATAISDESCRAWVLTALAPHLPPDLLDEALTAASTMTRGNARVDALTAVLPQLPPEQRATLTADALAAAADLQPDDQTRALTFLAPHLPPELLGEALAVASRLAADHLRVEVWAALIPHLQGDHQAAVLADASATATGLGAGTSRTRAVTRLAAHLPFEALAEAVTAAGSVDDLWERADLLADLIPHLPTQLRSTAAHVALAAAVAVPRENWRVRALARIAQVAPEAHLARILAELLAVTRPEWRAQALVWIAPHLPADLLGEALTATSDITDVHRRAEAWAALAAHLTAAGRTGEPQQTR